LNDDDVDKPIPLAWGKIRKAPIICTDRDASSTYHSFKICDTTNRSIKAITTVYVTSPGTAETSVAIHSPSTGTATFQLTAGVTYNPGETVTCDFQGYATGSTLIENSLDIIRDLLEDYGGITYGSANYNTVQWTAEGSNTYDIGVWIDESKQIVNIIEEISASNLGNFFIEGDGKYSFKTTDNTATSTTVITRDEEFDQPNASYKSDEFLTSVIIKYYKNENAGTYRRYLDNSEESTIYNKFSTYRQKTFETLITGTTAATAVATRIIGEFDDIKPIFKNTVKLQPASLELMDNFDLQVDRMNSTWYGDVKCECLGIDYNFDDFTITLTGRYIEDA
jgi:hypothetical protein